MKKIFIGLLASALVVIGLPLGNANAAPYCGITWGSLAKSNTTASSSSITNVRAGQHDCYDRLVFDLNGSAAGYDVKYVPAIYSQGEGMPISLSGGAKLQIIVRAPTYNSAGTTTYPALVGKRLPGIDLRGYQTFRDTAFGGSFEGQSSFGLGVRAQLPFRVFKDGNKLVVDVAHYW